MQKPRDKSPKDVISRGSAPRATFQIPDTGLRPSSDSFLARFRHAVSMSSSPHPAKPSQPAAATPPQAVPSAVPTASSPRYIDLSRPSQAARADATSADELAADAAEDTLINVLTDTDTDVATDPNTDYAAERDADMPDTPTRLAAAQPVAATSPLAALNPFARFSSSPSAKAIPQPQPPQPQQLQQSHPRPEAAVNLSPAVPAKPATSDQPSDSIATVLRISASHALLDQHALDQLGLPLGFVWSPFGTLPSAVNAPYAPPRCGTCGAFLGPGNGAEAVAAGARVWTCSFCGRNDNSTAGFYTPALLAPAVEYSVPEQSSQKHQNRHSAPLPARQTEERDQTNKNADIGTGHFSGGVNYSKSKTPPGAIVLVVDENIAEQQADRARAAAAAVYASAAARGLRFALLTVGAGCAAAIRADNATMSNSEGKSGDQNDKHSPTPTLDMLSVARAAKLTQEEKERFFFAAPTLPSGVEPDPHDPASLAHFHSITDQLIVPRAPYGEEVTNRTVDATHAYGAADGSPEGNRPAAATARDADTPLHTTHNSKVNGPINGVMNTAENDEASPARGDGEATTSTMPPREEPRRLDVGIFVALELLADAADCDHSRVLTLLSGPPTLSEHAQRRRRGHAGVGMNGHLSGTGVPGIVEQEEDAQLIAALTRLYEQVGSRAGEMRVALDFLNFGLPTEFGAHILLAAAKRSRGGLVYGAAHSFSAAEAVAEAATYLAQRSTTPGVVSIRVSSPLVVARVIGPAYPTAAPHTYAVPGVDPTAGFTIILKTKAGIEDAGEVQDHAVVQLAAKSGDVTRVITVRVPITRTPDEFLAGLDAEVCALVLAKACVVSAGGLTKPGVAARSVDEAVRRLLYGTEASVGVARLLYELRRGTLLHQHLSADAALVLRAWFLRAESGIASLLMSPRLFTNAVADKTTGLMGEIALERQHVREDAVLVLDTGFNVFVYVGEKASEAAEEAICKSAQGVAAMRVSPCQLWKLRQGPDADYVLDAYLSRGDGGKDEPAVERGFLGYCQWLAPKSDVVRALRYG